MTFSEAYERAHGYAWRIWDTEGKCALHNMLIEVKKAHEEEVKQALLKFPRLDEVAEPDAADSEQYDAACRHRAAWALKNWDDDEIVRESADDFMLMLYMKLYNEVPRDEPRDRLAVAIRDKLIGFLEA